MVSDFGAVNQTQPVIREFGQFINGYSKQLYLRRYITPVYQIEKLAKNISGGKISWSGYNLRNNNCEHYATCLKTGKRSSFQVETVNNFLGYMLFCYLSFLFQIIFKDVLKLD